MDSPPCECWSCLKAIIHAKDAEIARLKEQAVQREQAYEVLLRLTLAPELPEPLKEKLKASYESWKQLTAGATQ